MKTSTISGLGSARYLAIILATAVSGVCVLPTFAASDTEVGNNGTDGANGQVVNRGENSVAGAAQRMCE